MRTCKKYDRLLSRSERDQTSQELTLLLQQRRSQHGCIPPSIETGSSFSSSAKICMYINSTLIYFFADNSDFVMICTAGPSQNLLSLINSTFTKLRIFHTNFTFIMIRIYAIHVIITYRALSPETTFRNFITCFIRSGKPFCSRKL